MPWREQLAIYLDAAVATAAVSAALIAMAADRAFADARVSTALLYAIVFVGIMTATLVFDLAVRAELRLRGAYALLAGISVVATTWAGRTPSTRRSSRRCG